MPTRAKYATHRAYIFFTKVFLKLFLTRFVEKVDESLPARDLPVILFLDAENRRFRNAKIVIAQSTCFVLRLLNLVTAGAVYFIFLSGNTGGDSR
ncbi:MAG: hypothetical protein J5662_01600 [Clostridia bacterium]|nr:hypothetical protein [Clostridia bacterium]